MLSNEFPGIYLNGQWVKATGDQMLDSIDPTSERLIGSARSASKADIERAVGAARAAFDDGPWPRLSPAERAGFLRRIAQGMRARAEEFAHDLTREMGSTISQSIGAQLPIAIDLWEYNADLAETFEWQSTRSPFDSGNASFEILVRHQPVGVVAATLPWNAPHITTAMKAAPALAAGCTVILKPSLEATLTFELFAEVLDEAGLPPGVIGIVPADRELSEYLLTVPGIDKVSFTGSTAAGKQVAAVCGERLIDCTTELGGKSAAILLDDVDLATAMPALAPPMAFINGQACTAPTRILIPRSRASEITDAIVETVRALPLGDPTDPNTFLGPLVSARQRDRVEDYIRIGQRDGAKTLLGGGRPVDRSEGYFIEGTVFGDVDNSMVVAQEEIFGPVFCLIEYQDDAQAIRIANDSPYGLAGSVWTKDIDRALTISGAVHSGTVHINNHGADCAAPQGGVKMSGFGRERGPEGLQDFLYVKGTMLPRRTG